ncbi:L-2-hydroxyglutarate dehydrogenase [Anticarsia gemmatalis]|uniref:L-2-hydroxyglutarate dehydrogenase n=1 Tax=Anticarsia gemmatalis TaxID=129554 RepID=UPI003F758F96
MTASIAMQTARLTGFYNLRRYLSAAPTSTSSCHRTSNQTQEKYDVVVVGGGIVGTASARELILRHPKLKVAVVEKENDFALHQSGNNSGVIHAGIYYKPGSLKATLCVKGMDLMYKYCEENKILYKECGKLIVATEREEIPRLLELYDRGIKNGVKDLKLVDSKGIREIEPLCQGIQGIWSPHTGIVSYADVTKSYVKDITTNGGKSYLNFEVKTFKESTDPEYPVLLSNDKDLTVCAKYVLTCCGLHSDTVAVLTGCPENPKIIPFRGEYLYVKEEKCHLAKTNIYPVPDPRFPFLGVHITPRVDGRIILGPNALLAFSKEGYKWTDFNLKDIKEVMGFAGFQKLAMKYVGFGVKEMIKSLIVPLQVKGVQRFIKEIKTSDVESGPAGVRAQALSEDGSLIEDFVFDTRTGTGALGARVLHCRNAPSPGATSSLAIAMMITDKMEEHFKLK